MKTSFTMDFSDTIECADFFGALAATLRQMANAMKAVSVPLPVPSSEGRAAVAPPAPGAQPVEAVPDGIAGVETGASKTPRKRRTRAEMEAAQAAEAAALAASHAELPLPGGEPAAQALSTSTPAPATSTALPPDHLLDGDRGLRAVGVLLQKRGHTSWVVDELKKYGCTQFPKVPVEHRAALLTAMNAKLDALKKTDS
jgi:hypothetical protein